MNNLDLKELVESLEHDYGRPLWHEEHAEQCRRCKILARLDAVAKAARDEALTHANELSKWLSTALTAINRNVYDGAMTALRRFHSWKGDSLLTPAQLEKKLAEEREAALKGTPDGTRS